jgi:Rrf2 family protein
MSVISTRSRYGLRLLIDLAEVGGGEPVDLASIATRQGISETYLAKLAIPLLGAGILKSVRGPKGGYALARKPEEIDLFSVVEVLEGRSSLVECTARPEACPRSADCGARSLWSGLEAAVRDYLSSKSLASVASSSGQPEYYI